LPPSTAPHAAPLEKRGWLTEVGLALAIVALAAATTGWFISKRQIDSLRRDLESLRDSQRQLAAGVLQGRKDPAGPVGQSIDVSNAPARGRADAVVTLVEFSDYECPFCIRHFQQTMPRIDEHYIQPGKIRYVFRDFPIDSNHPQAIRAHEAARCALEQEKFWDLHNRLFSAPGTHESAALEERAKEAGLNVGAFRACLASGRTTASVRETEGIAESLGATGTPWFFVGLRDLKTNRVRVLRPIGGALPYEQFAAALDQALKQAEEK
jgi:protein-disulfide isomerase